MLATDLQWLKRDSGARIAYRKREGRSPTILFLPGYMSDMDGAKAVAIDAFAAEHGFACVRLDYSGTGSSGGKFDDGRLDLWLEEALTVVDELTEGPLVLAGSSMGGWLALHIALRRPDRVAGLLGIAAAPDFTDWGFSTEDRATLVRDGVIREIGADGGSSRYFTHGFWQSGQQMLLLGSEIAVDVLVRLVHGEQDIDVPVEIAHRLMGKLRSADIQLTIVKGGGHRLSAPNEIQAILHALSGLLELTR